VLKNVTSTINRMGSTCKQESGWVFDTALALRIQQGQFCNKARRQSKWFPNSAAANQHSDRSI
jgi:cytochrome b